MQSSLAFIAGPHRPFNAIERQAAFSMDGNESLLSNHMKTSASLKYFQQTESRHWGGIP
jgi:hypothetical protein